MSKVLLTIIFFQVWRLQSFINVEDERQKYGDKWIFQKKNFLQ